jgi:hypothetical protein
VLGEGGVLFVPERPGRSRDSEVFVELPPGLRRGERHVAHQFMGLITAEMLNPGLPSVDFAVTDEERRAAVDEAVRRLVARHTRNEPCS